MFMKSGKESTRDFCCGFRAPGDLAYLSWLLPLFFSFPKCILTGVWCDMCNIILISTSLRLAWKLRSSKRSNYSVIGNKITFAQKTEPHEPALVYQLQRKNQILVILIWNKIFLVEKEDFDMWQRKMCYLLIFSYIVE